MNAKKIKKGENNESAGAVAGLPAGAMLPLWRVINHAFLSRILRWGLPAHASLVLLRLQVYPEDGAPAMLADRICLPRQTMTMALDALETRGLARREAHARDRRRKKVILTAAGRKLGSAVLQDLLDFEAEAMLAIPVKDRRRIKEVMTIFAEALRKLSAVSEPVMEPEK